MAFPPEPPGHPFAARLCATRPRTRLARAAAGFLAVAFLALAPLRAAAQEETVTLNFVNADIDAVVRAVAEITGRSFVVDPRVKGTINIVSARPVPKSLVYPTLLSALRLQGFAVVESGNVVKVVPEADAKVQGGAVGRAAVGAGGDRLVTQVITLRNESAAQMVNVLRPLISPNNTIVAFPASNALVITDYADNLRRLERIVASLDQAPAGEPLIVTLKYASAIDVVTTVNRLITDSAGATPADAQQRVALVADARSNSVLLRSDNAGRAARVRSLIEQLDTPGRPGGNFFIVYLRNAEAARVAQTLRALLTGSESAPATVAGALQPQGAASLAGSTVGAAGTMNTPTPGTAPLPFTAASGSASFTANGATITADTANNALVIMAPEPVYNNLRAVIEKLDVRRAQVFVEALIAEVSADKAAEFGIQWQALTGYNTTQTRVVGGTNFGARGSGNNIIDVAVSPANAGQGLNLGVMRGTVSIPGLGTITNLGFLARALETQVGANILSTPTLLTLDNEEARIIVGQNIPLVTGSYATTGGTNTVTPFQTFERRDVGLVLRVRPQITEGGTVRLVLYQEVSRVEDASIQSGTILSKRALESSVIVDDTQIIVLGGLIEDRLTDGSDKVPLLGDVPALGALFRYDARRRQKTNLLIFIKTTVMRNGADGREITSERYQYLQSEQERLQAPPRIFWGEQGKPQLPPEGVMPGTPGVGEMPDLMSDRYRPPASLVQPPLPPQTAPAPAVPSPAPTPAAPVPARP